MQPDGRNCIASLKDAIHSSLLIVGYTNHPAYLVAPHFKDLLKLLQYIDLNLSFYSLGEKQSHIRNSDRIS